MLCFSLTLYYNWTCINMCALCMYNNIITDKITIMFLVSILHPFWFCVSIYAKSTSSLLAYRCTLQSFIFISVFFVAWLKIICSKLTRINIYRNNQLKALYIWITKECLIWVHVYSMIVHTQKKCLRLISIIICIPDHFMWPTCFINKYKTEMNFVGLL